MPSSQTTKLTVLSSPSQAWGPVCTGCGCFCHDLVFENGHLLDDKNCHLARTWAESGRRRIYGEMPAGLNGIMAEPVKELLQKAFQRRDLIAFTGLEQLEFSTQDVALCLAAELKAWILPGDGSETSDPWALAFAQKGAWQASWSEIRLRSDALLHWFAPTWQTHPRWVERFGPRSHHAHRLAVVQPETDVGETGMIEEQLLHLDPAHALAFLADLRLALRQHDHEPSDSRIRRLVHLFHQSHWLAIVRGEDPAGVVDPLGVAESFLSMVGEANSAEHRVVVADLPSAVNTAGLKTLLSWRAGLATPLWFSPEGPVYRPGEMQLSDFDGHIHYGRRLPSQKSKGWALWLNPDFSSNPEPLSSNIIEINVADEIDTDSAVMVRADGVVIRHPENINSEMMTTKRILGSIAHRIVELKRQSKGAHA